jgi:hypothetical protein
MAKIKKIEIICPPCHKCEILKERIEVIINCLEFKYNTRISYDFIHRETKKEVIDFLVHYGYTINQLPITLINDEICFIGHVKGENVIRWKLEEIMKTE